jgi:PPM family protein phosphatase
MITCDIFSEPGQNHANEDTVTVLHHPHEPSLVVCALSDGQGGQAGGSAASRTAVSTSMELALSHPASKLRDPRVWASILRSADRAVSDTDGAGYGTLVAMGITKGRVCGVSCGDSAALILHAGKVLPLTDNQQKNPPIGSNAAIPVVFTQKMNGPWKLLIMSDGVWKFAGWETIIQLLRSEKSQGLTAALRGAAAHNGPLIDDFSLVVMEWLE